MYAGPPTSLFKCCRGGITDKLTLTWTLFSNNSLHILTSGSDPMQWIIHRRFHISKIICLWRLTLYQAAIIQYTVLLPKNHSRFDVFCVKIREIKLYQFSKISPVSALFSSIFLNQFYAKILTCSLRIQKTRIFNKNQIGISGRWSNPKV